MEDKQVVTPAGDFYAESSVKNYKVVVKMLIQYERYLNQTFYLSDVNYQWCEDFRLWLIHDEYSKNTVANTLSLFKAFLRRMNKAGKCAFNGSGVQTPSEITTAVFTTLEELKYLMGLDLSKYQGIERIRDVYVCQCFIGLRVRDTIKLLSELPLHIREFAGKRFLEIKTSKKGEVVVIPMSCVVSEIAERRGYDFGKPFSQQYYIKTLKDLISKSEIEREVIFNRTEGGVMQERIMLYSDLIGTHSARRTFATNAYLAGLVPLDIMKITGHRSFNSFIRYIRCENIAVALRISDHDFFTNPFKRCLNVV